ISASRASSGAGRFTKSEWLSEKRESSEIHAAERRGAYREVSQIGSRCTRFPFNTITRLSSRRKSGALRDAARTQLVFDPFKNETERHPCDSSSDRSPTGVGMMLSTWSKFA